MQGEHAFKFKFVNFFVEKTLKPRRLYFFDAPQQKQLTCLNFPLKSIMLRRTTNIRETPLPIF